MAVRPEKRPREYAAEIIRLTSRDARQAALESVPAECRKVVRDYVEATFARRAALRARRAGG